MDPARTSKDEEEGYDEEEVGEERGDEEEIEEGDHEEGVEEEGGDVQTVEEGDHEEGVEEGDHEEGVEEEGGDVQTVEEGDHEEGVEEEGGDVQTVEEGDHEEGVEEGDHEERVEEEGGDEQEEEVEEEGGLEIQEVEDEGAVEEEVKAEGSDEIEEECGNEIAEELEEVHVLIDVYDHEDKNLHPSSKNESGFIMNVKLVWSKPYILFIAFAGNLSFFANSLVIGVFNEIFTELAQQYDETSLHWTSLVSPIIGAGVASLLLHRLGRKKVMIVSDVFVLGGLVGMAFSKTNWTLVGSWAFIGAGLGLGSAAAPVLLSESAPKKIRGAVVCTSGMASTIGQWAPYLILLISKRVNFSWRWTVGLSSVPTFIQLICMIFVQESPFRLAKQGKKGEVEKFLKRTFPAEEVQKEMDEIFQLSVEDCKKEEEEEVPAKNSFLKKIKTLMKSMPLRYLVGTALMQLLQHFLGLTFVLQVSPKLSDKAGLSKPVKSLLPKFLDLVTSLFVILSVDFLGRRKLMISTLLLLFCDQIVLGFLLGRSENQSLAKVCVGAMSIYLMVFTGGIGCIPILLTVEIVPYSYRGMASGMGSFFSWLGTLCTSRYTDFTVNKIGPSVFFIYSGVSVIVLFLVIFLIPEKAGAPLEEIDNSVGQTTKYQRLE